MDWRELFSMIISNKAERDRIAKEIGVHPATLTRWAAGESLPRAQNMRQLLRALPVSQRTRLRALLGSSATESTDLERDEISPEIPHKFIMDVLDARTNVSDLLRFWSITRLVLQQAIGHLDPERVGLAITVVRSMPPRDGMIRSLREGVGLGTAPWGSDFEEKALLLGAESLAGHVTVSCRLEQIGDLRTNKTFLPAYNAEHEVSAVACPIMYACRTAGCLLFSSTQPDYFFSEARLALVRNYTNLVALAFHPDEFYDPSLFALHVMPSPAIQQEYFSGFRLRVLKLMQIAVKTQEHLASADAEQLVWREIEAQLLDLPVS